MTYYNPSHWVQFALAGTQASGTQVASWISYSSWSNLNVQTLTSFGTTTTNSVSYSRDGDIAALNATTAANTKGTTAITNTTGQPVLATSGTTVASGWTDILTTVSGSGTSQLKVGDSITYTAGYKVFASATATTPTAQASGSGKFTIVDGATALSLSAGVAAAIAMIAF
jgi:hypothetical protein